MSFWPTKLTPERAAFHRERPDWEVMRVDSIIGNISQGTVLVDVGTECGDYAALFAYWLWMLGLVLAPFSRVHGLCLLAVSAVGFSLRRNSGLKWVLVILTFEGAVRVGLLVSLFGMAWRRL